MTRARDTAGIIQYNKITVDSNNAVGIGSSIPDCKLDINGGLRVVGVSTFEDKTYFEETGLFSYNKQLNFGTNAQQEGSLYATSEWFYINSGATTYGMNIQANSIAIRSATGGENYFTASINGGALLYYDDAEKLQTTGIGITVTGAIHADGLSVGDDERINVGISSDLQIYHNGTDDFITSGGSTLKISGSRIAINNAANNENQAVFTENGAVELYYDNSKKLETVTGGVTITGTLAATALTGNGSQLTGLPEGTNILKAMLFV